LDTENKDEEVEDSELVVETVTDVDDSTKVDEVDEEEDDEEACS
jgi:hypothetical protein